MSAARRFVWGQGEDASMKAVGVAGDARTYRLAAAILGDLGVASARLLSGNPEKLGALTGVGIEAHLEPWVLENWVSSEARVEYRTKQCRGYSTVFVDDHAESGARREPPAR